MVASAKHSVHGCVPNANQMTPMSPVGVENTLMLIFESAGGKSTAQGGG